MRQTRPLTGRQVGLTFVAFFAVVTAVNVVMIRAAVSTFTGIETKNPYQAGLLFDREIVAATEQDRRHWQVEVRLQTDKGNVPTLSVLAKDGAGLPLSGLEVRARFVHPVTAKLDRPFLVKEIAPGRYQSDIDDLSGIWDLELALARDGVRLFQSTNRVVFNASQTGKRS